MLSFLWLILYIASGILIVNSLLPQKRPVIRCWLGTAVGVMLMMWLPALCAFVFSFSIQAHWISLFPLGLLILASHFLRDQHPCKEFSAEDSLSVKLLLALALPLTVLSFYLIWTHDLRPAADGSLHTGQACYGDLSLHLSIITSLRNAPFPADYAIMPGNLLSYPFLTDSFTTSFMLGGCTLRAALLVSPFIMLSLVFAGYTLLCQRLCKTKPGMFIAALLFFLNGGFGFVYILDMLYVPLGTRDQNSLQSGIGLLERLDYVIKGNSWYQTPTNHAEFDTYNLRWSNVIADMLIPQRTTMGGWSMLMPCLWLLTDTILTENTRLESGASTLSKVKPSAYRQVILLGILAGGLPMVHTHSFAALAFCSFGMLMYCLYPIIKSKHYHYFSLWLIYAFIAAVLAVPQLFTWTFSQAFKTIEGTGSFITFHFNWVNRYADGLKDSYLWFYLKNVGLPFLLIIFAMFEKNRRFRLLLSGAAVIFILAEFIRFQPNEYDNNKLFYVWYMLCVPVVADYSVILWHKLKDVRARPVIAVLCAIVCFLSGTLSIAHECVTDWQLYSDEDVQTANYIEENLPQHAVFMTGRQHLNPVSSLAGRKIVCGPDLWLHYHGLDTNLRSGDIRAFYQDPENNQDILEKYGVEYILVSGWERSDYYVDDDAMESLYPVIFESEYGSLTIYDVRGGLSNEP